MKKADTVILEMSADLEVIDPVQSYTSDICRGLGFGEEDSYWIGMAVREALNNAVLHGNKLDPSKKVFMQLDVHKDRLVITVWDEGPGFSKDKIPDPLLPENILKMSGRGLFYISRFMDSVDYAEVDKKGARLSMVKMISQGTKHKKKTGADAGS